MHFWSKIPNEGIFGHKSRQFCLFSKFCNCTNSRVLISNMTTVFQNSSKKYPDKALLVPNLSIFIISQYFAIRKIQRLLISNMTIVLLKLYPKKIQIRHFWSKIPKSGILGPKFRHFCFFAKFCKQTNLKLLISNMTIVFLKFLPKNTQIRHFWSQIQAFLFLHKILQIH